MAKTSVFPSPSASCAATYRAAVVVLSGKARKLARKSADAVPDGLWIKCPKCGKQIALTKKADAPTPPAPAPETPPVYSSPVNEAGRTGLDRAFNRSAEYYAVNGDAGLLGKIRAELKQSANRVREMVERDKVFHREDTP